MLSKEFIDDFNNRLEIEIDYYHDKEIISFIRLYEDQVTSKGCFNWYQFSYTENLNINKKTSKLENLICNDLDKIVLNIKDMEKCQENPEELEADIEIYWEDLQREFEDIFEIIGRWRDDLELLRRIREIKKNIEKYFSTIEDIWHDVTTRFIQDVFEDTIE